MSEIQFKKLSIENFLSIGEGDIDLDNRGLLLIQGMNEDDSSANSNGSGKSSTVDALCWAIYGITARGKSGDGVVNRFEGKNCKVEVTFTLNGKTYLITRHRKHSKGKNRLLFTCDGADLTLGTDKLTQDLIEKTIGCNQEVFTASIYAGQNNMPNLPAMTDKELKLLVERAAGIELLDSAYDIARERARSIEVAVGAADTAYQAALTYQHNCDARLESLRNSAENWESRRTHDVHVMSDELRLALKDVQSFKAKLDTFDEAGKQAEIDELEGKLAAKSTWEAPTPPSPPTFAHLPPIPKKLNELTGSIAFTKRQQAQIEAELRTTLLAAKNLTERVGTPCGECGKPIAEEDLDAHKRQLVAKAKAFQVSLAECKRAQETMGAEVAEIEELHRAESDVVASQNASLDEEFQARQEAHSVALRAYREAIASDDSDKIVAKLRDAQRALSEHSNNKTALNAALTRIKMQKENLEKRKAEENPNQPLIDQARQDVDDAVQVLSDKTNAIQLANEQKSHIAVVVEMFSPKGMRGEVLDSVTPFLNDRTSQYLGTLSDGNITAEWKTVGETGKGELREKFHIEVANDKGDDEYTGLSGGEQRKVRISTAMALQDLVASRADRPIKLFIADEADDALDVSGLERLMAVLDEKARNVGTVLVISHNDLADWIPNTLTVIKKGGKSAIVEV